MIESHDIYDASRRFEGASPEALPKGRGWGSKEALWSAAPRVRGIAGAPRSGASRDPAGRDVEYGGTLHHVGECRRIGAGHPHLGAEPFELIIERGAPHRIEVGDDLVEQD